MRRLGSNLVKLFTSYILQTRVDKIYRMPRGIIEERFSSLSGKPYESQIKEDHAY